MLLNTGLFLFVFLGRAVETSSLWQKSKTFVWRPGSNLLFGLTRFMTFPLTLDGFSGLCQFFQWLNWEVDTFSIFFQIWKSVYFLFYSFFSLPASWISNDIASVKSNCFWISGAPTGLIPTAFIIFVAFVLGVRRNADVAFP